MLVGNIVVVYTSVGYCGGKETCGLDAHDVCRLGLAATLVEDDVELVVLGGDGEFLIVPFLAVDHLGLALHQLAGPVAQELALAVPGIEVDGGEVGLAVHRGGVGYETFLLLAFCLFLGLDGLQLLVPLLHEFVAQVVLVVVAGEDEGVRGSIVPGGIAAYAGSHGNYQRTLLSLHHIGKGGRAVLNVLVGALAVYACYAACGNLSAYVGLAIQPVRQEDARCAGHCQHEGIGGNGVLLQGVKGFVLVAVLGVVVLHEGYRPLTVAFLVCQGIVAGIGRIGQKVLAIVAIEGVTHAVAELEVEGSTGGHTVRGGSVHPLLYVVAAVPVLAHGVLCLACRIVFCNEGGRESLYHIVAEARITEVVEQIVLVGLDDALYVGRLVVHVAASAPVLAGVVVLRQAHTVLLGLCEGGTAVVVLADVRALELVGLALIGLLGEGKPALGVVVVDDNVGYRAYAVLLEGGYHAAQLGLVAEGRVLVPEVQGHVAHVVVAGAIARVGYPH